MSSVPNASIFLENDDTVLFIQGINVNKINNDLHGNGTLYVENDNFNYNDEINNKFDKITKKYINYELWESNNINCWYCTLNLLPGQTIGRVWWSTKSGFFGEMFWSRSFRLYYE